MLLLILVTMSCAPLQPSPATTAVQEQEEQCCAEPSGDILSASAKPTPEDQRVENESPKDSEERIEILRALRPIPAGSPLSRDDFETQEVPAHYLPSSPLRWIDFDIYVHMPLSRDIPAGDMLMVSDLNKARTSLSEIIRPEERAMVLPLDPVSGLTRLLSPGDYVDIIGIFPSSTRNQPDPAFSVLLDRVKILAIGGHLSPFPPENRPDPAVDSLVLSVTFSELIMLTRAQQYGQVIVAPRNQSDQTFAPSIDPPPAQLGDVNSLREQRKTRSQFGAEGPTQAAPLIRN